MGGRPFKIVIVGGSVAGLTLASLLEQFGIDYVLLERHHEIAPQVGASIGVWPSGQRILDQIGGYEALRKLDDCPMTRVALWVHGVLYCKFEGSPLHSARRLGYTNIFVDRQMLLQILYDNVKDKSKILLNKKVVKTTTSSMGASVETEDGHIYSGDIVIGADGVHSLVRKQMRQIAAKASPGYFPEGEENKVPGYYCCLFGISRPMKTLPGGLVNPNMEKGCSYLIIGGTGNRVYWFLFEKLESIQYGDKIRRYTEKDKDELVARHRADVVGADKTTFGDVYDNAIATTLSPLHEHVYSKWHFGRIITLGDSAHKMNPITGHGGNSAMESAAAFVNFLNRKMDERPEGLSQADIEHVFKQTHALRYDRVKKLTDMAHKVQANNALENWYTKYIVRFVLPWSTIDTRITMQTNDWVDAVSVERLPIPDRGRYVPFIDELPAKPLTSAGLVKLVTAACLAWLFYISFQAFKIGPLPESFRGTPFTELKNEMLARVIKIFSALVAIDEPNQRLQGVYAVTTLLAFVLVWTIEGNRRGNGHSSLGFLVKYPALWAFAYQIRGAGKVAPMYYLVSLLTTNNVMYNRTSGRIIEIATAKALLPAVCIGYILPSILMLLPYENHAFWQIMIVLWQFAPIITPSLVTLIAALIQKWQPPRKAVDLTIYDKHDLPPLRTTYAFTFFFLALMHVTTMVYIAGSDTLSFWRIFGDLPNPFLPWDRSNAEAAIFIFFKWDLNLCAAAAVVFCLYSIFDLRKLGYVTTADAVKAAWAVVVGSFAVGPGATYVGLWWWRENVIAALSKC